MSDLKIAVILGSTRPGRNGKAVADWVVDRAKDRTGATYDLVDLADFPLPHLDEALPPTLGQYAGEHTKARAEKTAAYDGFVFVTPEYNHSTSGVRQQLSFSLCTDFENFTVFRPAPLHQDMTVVLFDQLEAWAGALKPLRASQAAAA